MRIDETPLPENALLQKYVKSGDYTDCFSVVIDKHVSQADFIEAFYNSRVFKLERFILTCLVFKPSSDRQAAQLAIGTIEKYAAWNLEARNENQLLMCDFKQATRSWLMTEKIEPNESTQTRLFFGSALIARTNQQNNEKSIPFLIKSMVPAHQFYSKCLLNSTAAKLLRTA